MNHEIQGKSKVSVSSRPGARFSITQKWLKTGGATKPRRYRAKLVFLRLLRNQVWTQTWKHTKTAILAESGEPGVPDPREGLHFQKPSLAVEKHRC